MPWTGITDERYECAKEHGAYLRNEAQLAFRPLSIPPSEQHRKPVQDCDLHRSGVLAQFFRNRRAQEQSRESLGSLMKRYEWIDDSVDDLFQRSIDAIYGEIALYSTQSCGITAGKFFGKLRPAPRS
jgi:hypothetical protein